LAPKIDRNSRPSMTSKAGFSTPRGRKRPFERGLKYCGELDGNHFYFLARDRVLDLE